MTEEEIKLVAELLAKIGGNWYPDRTGPAPRAVSNRHRDVARLIIEAVERSQAVTQSANDDHSSSEGSLDGKAPNLIGEDQLHVGATVVYRPPGDKRTLACRIEKMEQGRVYLVPALREIGWVSTHTLLPLKQNRESATRPRVAPPSAPGDGMDLHTYAPATDAVTLNPNPQLRVGEPPARVQHYFSSSGEWIAFRRYRSDRYLFDRKGNWIGWFPWDDNDAVDLNGQYLGTVIDGDRFYRRTSSDMKKREAGFVVHPGRGGYAGYPGYVAHRLPPFGFKDIDLTKIPTGQRFWLKGHSQIDTHPGKMSTFHIWMSKIGLGRVARWIEGTIRSS